MYLFTEYSSKSINWDAQLMKLVKSWVAEPGSSQYSRNFFLVLKRYKFFIVILRLLFSNTNNKEYLKKPDMATFDQRNCI